MYKVITCSVLLLLSHFAIAQQSCVLDTQWLTPTPTPIAYGFGGGWISGVPDPVNSTQPTDPKGIFEGYTSPNPGILAVERIRVGLQSLLDVNDNMTVKAVLHDDNGSGAPGSLIAESISVSPTSLGVPLFVDPSTDPSQEYWFDLPANSIPATGFFHVGLMITAGDADDTLIVQTSCLGPPGCAVLEGEGDASNHIFTSGFGYENFLTVYGADFDVNIIPKLKGPDLSFNYDSPIYYTDDTDPIPTITGVTGGAFSSDPTGLIINPMTGEIDVSASTIGDYIVSYTGSTPTTCIDSSNQIVSIQAPTPVELLNFSIE